MAWRLAVARFLALPVVLAAGACGPDTTLAERGSGGSSQAGAPGGAVGGGAGAAAGNGGVTTTPCTITYEDRDGDEWRKLYLVGDCTQQDPLSGDDCDDSDATRQRLVFADQDGDGAGTDAETLCVPAGDAPDGYSLLSNDCDDADPTLGPLLLDTPGDGIDQDCDGLDAALCSAGAADCPCADLVAEPPPSSPSCASFDLTVLDASACRLGCSGTQFVRIANLGPRDFVGHVLLTQGNLTEEFSGTIAAGAVTAPRRLMTVSIDYQLTLTSDPADCNPDNDVFGTGLLPDQEPLCLPR